MALLEKHCVVLGQSSELAATPSPGCVGLHAVDASVFQHRVWGHPRFLECSPQKTEGGILE